MRAQSADDTRIPEKGRFLQKPGTKGTWKEPIITREPAICQGLYLQSPEIPHFVIKWFHIILACPKLNTVHLFFLPAPPPRLPISAPTPIFPGIFHPQAPVLQVSSGWYLCSSQEPALSSPTAPFHKLSLFSLPWGSPPPAPLCSHPPCVL